MLIISDCVLVESLTFDEGVERLNACIVPRISFSRVTLYAFIPEHFNVFLSNEMDALITMNNDWLS